VVGLLLLGCPSGGGTNAQLSEPAAPNPQRHNDATLRYEVEVAPDLSTLEVRLCFDASPEGRLVPSNRRGRDYIERVRTGTTALHRTRGTYSLEGIASGECIDYAVHLSGMARAEGFSRYIREAGDSVMLRQGMWLWHPDRLQPDTPLEITLKLPPGVQASVPWKVADGHDRDARSCTYEADTTAFRWLGYTAFGALSVQRFPYAGTEVEVAKLDAPMEATDPGLRAWAEDAVASTAALFDGYPREHIQFLVLPVDGGGSGPAYFGMAGRGGGAGVYVLLDDAAPDESLPGGWTTTHELLHHGMPFIEDAWMGEGWVSYYTELQRTRRGLRDERAGWTALVEAFDRGRRTRRPGTLQSVSDNMHTSFAYQRVYWGGAAIAFFTDLALRKDSGGKTSLDDAMRELRNCCGDARHRWKAQVLLRKLDAWYGKPLFTETAANVLSAEGFPDVDAALAELGVTRSDAGVVLDDDHPGAPTRRALMAPRKD
jgi:hypothetical protein